MLPDVFSQVQEFLSNNQLIGTVAGSSLVVWLVSNIKTFYFTIKKWLVNLVSFHIVNLYVDDHGDCSYKQDAFNDILAEATPIWDRTVNLKLGYGSSEQIESTDSIKNNVYGAAVKLVYGKLCFVTSVYRISNSKNNIQTQVQVFFARKKAFLAKLNDDIQRRVAEKRRDAMTSNHVVVYTESGASFVKNKRSLDSIFTNGNEHKKAYDNICKFISNKETYKKLNYPYNYCCCFYGKPGCGKTSTILAIASALNMNIKYINLAGISTQGLLAEMSGRTDPKCTLFVFEDIDAVTTNATSKRVALASRCADSETCVSESAIIEPEIQECISNDKSVSLSDILNITDGLLSNDGSICIFTTNHIEKLDPALLRAGRMNDLIEFSYLNAQTANKMIKHHLGYELENLKDDIKPAELQEMILNVTTGYATKEQLVEKFCSELN